MRMIILKRLREREQASGIKTKENEEGELVGRFQPYSGPNHVMESLPHSLSLSLVATPFWMVVRQVAQAGG